MPILDVSFQVILFLVAVGSGFAMGCVYDFIRIFRRIIYHPAVFMFVEDVLYWIFSSAIVFYIMLVMTKGEVRFFAIFGFFMGMVVYFFTLSILIIKSAEFIIKILKKIFGKVLSIILFPFKMLYKILSKLLHPFNAIFTKFIKNVKRVLKKYKNYVRILLRGLVPKEIGDKKTKETEGD